MSTSELARHEERAQHGIIEFAEEMQAIRNVKLYPKAGQKDAWKTYCQERWGMSESSVKAAIQAMPVIKRLASDGVAVAVTTAAAVATLPEKVQDAILEDSPKRDTVKARAKAARSEIKRAEKVGKAVDEAKVIAKAMKAKPSKPRKPSAPMAPREDLQPRTSDEFHGYVLDPLSKAAFETWRSYERSKDRVFEAEKEAELVLILTSRMRQTLDAIDAFARGEATITDEDLAEFMRSLA